MRIKRTPHRLSIECDGETLAVDIRPLSARQSDALIADASTADARTLIGVWAQILDDNIERIHPLHDEAGADISAVAALDRAARAEIINQLGYRFASATLAAYMAHVRGAGDEGKSASG